MPVETTTTTTSTVTYWGLPAWEWLVIAVAVILFLWIIGIYNTFVKLRNVIENAFADIDVQLKLRFDLVGNLVNTVKGYAHHEQSTLQSVTDARTHYLNAQTTDDKIEANNQLSGALKSLFAVSEAYPDLKANTNFLQLQTELADIENKLAASRRYFNASVKEYNTALQVFPANVIARLFGFAPRPYFELTGDAERATPTVSFDDK